ncbi:ABC transporter permease [Schinkia azotoformans]|uniref:ABC transporter permease n=1 Tax=Schinkia azotoformans LMG 9581 TaxID=1131731 RepID=K6ECN8_SCHAZ|nr:ABC transporter permease [Schinkia azotoformans]EKN71206.1 ABC transporter permease [Schinkia azotoformans LMG 9581]MEC1638919.1 ABC transporter permease [Schinkia azotoformans]MEC1720945.1 ABC transporter permease [Schinkia azotoformans]MEC1946884.1 ABC transporter permease [Schinkia azotoformans]MED4353103.1 ABC transporter permease [Schinkia azotoformans]
MDKFKYYFSSITIILCVFIFWEIGAAIVNKKYILPSPTQILLKLWDLKGVLFLNHLPATMLIIIVGLLTSIIIGVGLAVWMNMNKSVEKAFYPLLIASQTVPIIALAPIFVLWFGYSIWGKVVVTVLITFFPITVSTFDGLRSIKSELEELFLTMGASKKEIFFKLSIPTALPFFYSGLKVAVTLSVIGAAIGEWLGAKAGLGYFSRRMMTQFDGAGVFAPIILLSFIGILLFLLVTYLEKISFKWRKIK